ncbi:hypothetical protein RQM65_02505 [Pricia sp. S334]|uniref:Uncharacterized protein n=1 Tax=Pricia mediterranea TaxID=3076079 RepID=A0ABU3L1P2_9FLAO|nr:hypothetical protein [Pricia sp. S334]MDT7827535.1 hypothetical protein [Pricia sp. S334]
MGSTFKIGTLRVSGGLFACLILFFCSFPVLGQQTQRVNPQLARGSFINDVRIVLVQDSLQTPATQKELDNFYNACFIKPGTTFNPLITDLAISRITQQDNVKNAYYELYDAETGSGTVNRPLTIIIYIEMLVEGEAGLKEKGMLASKNISDFPLLYETPQSQFKFLVNGGVGLYNDENALFGQGTAFTQGNPIADNPAGKGNRFGARLL